MEKIKKIVGNNIREYTMVVALVVIVLFFQITMDLSLIHIYAPYQREAA